MPTPTTTGPRSVIVALGFATTVAMWAIGYTCMTGPGLIVGEALFIIELLAIVGGGFFAGKVLGSAKAGLWVGGVSATVNLLIIGSLLSDRGPSAVAWVVGLYVVSIVLCGLGAVVGCRFSTQRTLPSATSLFSIITATTVFLLLITGGLVTGLEAGLAVPDWPNSFGHNMLLYPLSEMTEGIYYEHAHRLYGMLVGLSSIALLAIIFLHDRRTWVRLLMTALFVMVCVQGLMGGLRVTGTLTLDQEGLQPSVVLAIVHGVFGQLIFAGFCWLAVATSRAWNQPEARWSIGPAPLALVGALFIQLVLGACYRHLQVPATETTSAHHPMGPLVGHLTFSVVVMLLSVFVGLRTMKLAEHRLPKALGHAVLGFVGLQFILGVGALGAVLMRQSGEFSILEVILTSAHQANGALMLGTAAALAALLMKKRPI